MPAVVHLHGRDWHTVELLVRSFERRIRSLVRSLVFQRYTDDILCQRVVLLNITWLVLRVSYGVLL